MLKLLKNTCKLLRCASENSKAKPITHPSVRAERPGRKSGHFFIKIILLNIYEVTRGAMVPECLLSNFYYLEL